MVANGSHLICLERYLSMSFEELENLVNQYPYFVFPKIALHLKNEWTLDLENETAYTRFPDSKKVQWYECQVRVDNAAEPAIVSSVEPTQELEHTSPLDSESEEESIIEDELSPSTEVEHPREHQVTISEPTHEVEEPLSNVSEDQGALAFTSWLDQFSSQASPSVSQKDIVEPQISEIQEPKTESIQEEDSFFEIDKIKFEEQVKDEKVLAQETIYEDEELEVVLGSFVKDQMEKTVSKRKTPYEHTSFEIDEKIIDNETFVSETMALLYAEQGLNAKAIDLYKKLIIRIPQKSVFFANQIDKLK